MANLLIKRALEAVNSEIYRSEFRRGDLRRADEFVSEGANDRRYKLHFKAMAGSDLLGSCIVEYRGTRYYAYYDSPVGEFVVEFAGRR